MKTRWHVILLAIWGLLTGNLYAEEPPEWALASRLTGDRQARRVGDLLTVIIEEISSGKVDAKQSTDKSFDVGGSASVSHPRIDARSVPWTNATIPSYSASASRKFDGQGSMENNGTLSGSVTVRVIDILPGGHLLIEGKRSVEVQNESLTFTLMGTVRREDVAADNTIQSSRIGDLTIRYQSAGSIATAQKKGLLTSIFDFINPF
ncbi:MAG: flagellar basal body L-ring protein FlgH [bacterium]